MNKNRNFKAASLVRSAMIAAIYVVLTLIAGSLGLASGAIQIRLSEALTLLPILFPEAIAGLTIGCLIANAVTGCVTLDIIFGTLATLIGAYGTYLARKCRPLAILSPIASNALIVPFVLKYAYGLGEAWWYMFVTVGIGEIISCAILGSMLLKIIEKYN